MSRPRSSATDFAHHSVRGPRERRPLRPTRTAPPSSRSGRKTIPTDKFLDDLQSPEYYAELYPDVLPLTRKLYLQLRTQEASGMPGPNLPWTETRLDSEDNHARSGGIEGTRGLDKANDELRQSGAGGYHADVGDLDVQTMPCDRSSSTSPGSSPAPDCDCEDEDMDVESGRARGARVGSFLDMDDENEDEDSAETTDHTDFRRWDGERGEYEGAPRAPDQGPRCVMDIVERGEWAGRRALPSGKGMMPSPGAGRGDTGEYCEQWDIEVFGKKVPGY